MGTFRERQTRPILLPHAARTETARDGAFEMGSALSRDWLDSGPRRRGGKVTSLFRRLRWWLRRSDKEAELRDELQFHLEAETEERQGDGLSQQAARLA